MCLGGIIGSVAGGLISSNGASKAAEAQQAAAAQQIELERDIYNDTVERFEPYYQGNLDFYNALRYELLGGDVPMIGAYTPEIIEEKSRVLGRPLTGGSLARMKAEGRTTGNAFRPFMGAGRMQYRVGDNVFSTREEAERYAAENTTGGHAYKGYEATPMFKRALAEGQAAIDSSAASRGNVFSGATLEAQQTLGTELALQDYGNYLNRLTGQAAQGQAAAGNIATAGSNYASGAGTAIANAGNAQAAGYIGQANALTGAINNAFGAWGYMNQPSNMMTASNGVQVPTNTFNSVQALF